MKILLGSGLINSRIRFLNSEKDNSGYLNLSFPFYDHGWKGYDGDRDMTLIRFLLFCKREIIFETIFWIAGASNQVSDRAFPWKFL